jgi:hypothetical protein
MPQPIPEAADLPPWNIRAELRSGTSEFRRRFADNHQGAFDGKDDLFIVRESRRVQAFGKPLNVPDVR